MKNDVVYEINCSNCEAVYFGESKRSLKSRSDEHKNLSETGIMKILNCKALLGSRSELYLGSEEVSFLV